MSRQDEWWEGDTPEAEASDYVARTLTCAHGELAFNESRIWCETCGATLDPDDTTQTIGDKT